jgi:hypothetical protein
VSEAMTYKLPPLQTGTPEQNALWDHIYEYGHTSEGVQRLLEKVCQAYAITAIEVQGVPEVSTEHGPWVPSTLHEGETYCKRCLLRSAFLGARECEPHIKESTPPAPQAYEMQQEPVKRTEKQLADDAICDHPAYCNPCEALTTSSKCAKQAKPQPLSDEQIIDLRKSTGPAKGYTLWADTIGFARAIESAATEPLLQRIAELEEENKLLNSLMRSGEQRGVSKGLEECKERIAELERELEKEKQYVKEMTKDRDHWMTVAAERALLLDKNRKVNKPISDYEFDEIG